MSEHKKLVREVKRYIKDTIPKPVSIPKLCRRFKVHRRMLHRAFIEEVGMPPIAYSHRKRLNKVRSDLKKKGRSKLIRDIAKKHGFTEMGRFAGEYRRAFGETPRDTVRG